MVIFKKGGYTTERFKDVRVSVSKEYPTIYVAVNKYFFKGKSMAGYLLAYDKESDKFWLIYSNDGYMLRLQFDGDRNVKATIPITRMARRGEHGDKIYSLLDKYRGKEIPSKMHDNFDIELEPDEDL